eukprot:scaffold104190_cov67-Phaeocystis_antarctica.AAC.2
MSVSEASMPSNPAARTPAHARAASARRLSPQAERKRTNRMAAKLRAASRAAGTSRPEQAVPTLRARCRGVTIVAGKRNNVVTSVVAAPKKKGESKHGKKARLGRNEYRDAMQE